MCHECDDRDGCFHCEECSRTICLEPTDRFFQTQAVKQGDYWLCEKCATEYRIYSRDEPVENDIPNDADLCPPV